MPLNQSGEFSMEIGVLYLSRAKVCSLSEWFFIISVEVSIVLQLDKCLKFMTFREACFVKHAECKYSSEALETFYHPHFYKR